MTAHGLLRGHVPLPGAAVIAALIAASCVITDDGCLVTQVAIRFDDSGMEASITLGRPVRLPLDETDAAYIMESCACTCRGSLVRVGDYWQYPEEAGTEACLVRIHVATGAVECFPGP
ncbi:MAG TPA: hypothetical protein PLW83_03550 [Deltaproteobacteria bacterium]|nr:hypothetical protein [Deltaproteobacteria bacterium]